MKLLERTLMSVGGKSNRLAHDDMPKRELGYTV